MKTSGFLNNYKNQMMAMNGTKDSNGNESVGNQELQQKVIIHATKYYYQILNNILEPVSTILAIQHYYPT